MRIGVIAIQGAVSEHVEALERALSGRGESAEIVEIKHRGMVPTCDALVLPGGEIVIKDVEKGSHFLQGEADGYNTIERQIDLDKDFVWTVY